MKEHDSFEFWQDHSLEYLEMAFKKDFQERIQSPDGYGIRTGECGDTIEFFIKLKEGALDVISYDINGCTNTNACANTVIHLASGKTVEDAWNVSHEDIAAFLKTLPEDELHCAELAAGAFYLALKDASETCPE